MFVGPPRPFRRPFSTSSISRADFTHVVSIRNFQPLGLEVEGWNRLSAQELLAWPLLASSLSETGLQLYSSRGIALQAQKQAAEILK